MFLIHLPSCLPLLSWNMFHLFSKVTLISAFIILLLVSTEFLDWTRSQMVPSLVVDKGRREKMQINVNVTFPNIPCYCKRLKERRERERRRERILQANALCISLSLSILSIKFGCHGCLWRSPKWYRSLYIQDSRRSFRPLGWNKGKIGRGRKKDKYYYHCWCCRWETTTTTFVWKLLWCRKGKKWRLL